MKLTFWLLLRFCVPFSLSHSGGGGGGGGVLLVFDNRLNRTAVQGFVNLVQDLVHRPAENK